MLAVAIAFFVALPQAVAAGLNRLLHLGLEVQSAPFQAMTGALKLAVVIGYLVAIRRIPEWSYVTGLVSDSRALHLDDLCALICQPHRRVRAGYKVFDRQHSDAFERSYVGHIVSPSSDLDLNRLATNGAGTDTKGPAGF